MFKNSIIQEDSVKSRHLSKSVSQSYELHWSLCVGQICVCILTALHYQKLREKAILNYEAVCPWGWHASFVIRSQGNKMYSVWQQCFLHKEHHHWVFVFKPLSQLSTAGRRRFSNAWPVLAQEPELGERATEAGSETSMDIMKRWRDRTGCWGRRLIIRLHWSPSQDHENIE